MKKIILLILSFLCLFSLVACTENKDIDNNSENETIENNLKSETEEINFSEIVVVDNEECSIVISDIDFDNLWSFTLKTQLENKSAEKTYMYSIESASINGVETTPIFATEVAAGKKANDDILFADSDLEENNIGKYTDIELTFRVYDSNDWFADEVAKETIHVYPYGENNASQFIREPQESDNIIIDTEDITVIVTGYDKNSLSGYSINMYLINKTDKTVMFSIDEASINGYMIDPYYATSIHAGKSAFSTISWYNSELEENNIIEIEEIEFKLKAYDYDDWFSDDFVYETITLKP